MVIILSFFLPSVILLRSHFVQLMPCCIKNVKKFHIFSYIIWTIRGELCKNVELNEGDDDSSW